MEPPMSEEKVARILVKPTIEGLDEVEGALDEAMKHVMAAQNALDAARAKTLTVTALAEIEEPTD